MKKRENTARRVAPQKAEIKAVRKHGRNLSRKQIRVEQSFRICLQIVGVLLANGLLREKEAVRVRKRLIMIYDPVVGSLLDFDSWEV